MLVVTLSYKRHSPHCEFDDYQSDLMFHHFVSVLISQQIQPIRQQEEVALSLNFA